MNEREENKGGTLRQASSECSSQTAELFRAQWKRALKGDAHPKLEEFLANAADVDRNDLLQELEKIDAEYRQQVKDTARFDTEKTLVDDNAATDEGKSEAGRDATLVSVDGLRAEDQQQAKDTASRSHTSIIPPADGKDETLVSRPDQRPQDSASKPISRRSSPSAGLEAALGALEDYELLEELGRGGMGVVYKARDKRVNRIVALKMMLGGRFASKDSVRRFELEAEAAASLDHPHIVPIYHVDEVEGLPYFTMRYIAGTSLQDFARENLSGDPRAAADLMRKVSLAVHYAHSRGILHRDLKPANILIDPQDEPHITDFGLAKKLDQDRSETQTGALLGTPDYMSPEQAAGLTQKVSVASDIYSLGSILFDLLTGEPPFRSNTVMQTLVRVTKEPARAPTSLNRNIGPDLETICLKCLEKEPEQRYGSAQELADELERYLQGRPILGRPVSKLEQAQRWCRRNPVVATLTAAVCLLIVVSLVGLNVALLQISHQRDAAEANERAAVENAMAADIAKAAADDARTKALRNEAITAETLRAVVQEFQVNLRDRPDLYDVRENLLTRLLAKLEHLDDADQDLAELEDVEDIKQSTTAAAQQHLADIFLETGRLEAARDYFRQASERIEKLHSASPNEPRNKHRMAACMNKLADTSIRLGQLTAAIDYYVQGRQYRQQRVELMERQSHIDKWELINAKWDVAVSHLLLSDTELRMGHVDTAHGYLREADEWAKAVPDDAEFERANDFLEMAFLMASHGDLSLRISDDTDAARAHYEEAVNLLKRGLELAEKDSAAESMKFQSVRLERDLAANYISLGNVDLHFGNNPTRANGYYQEAARLCLALRDRDPNNLTVAKIAADALYCQGTAALLLEDATSNYYFQQCLDLCRELAEKSPLDLDFQLALMMALARNGRPGEATEIAERVRQEVSEPLGAYAAARCYAVCAASVSAALGGELTADQEELKTRYTGQAVAALRDALDQGWRDFTTLKTDPDWNAVRSLEDFDALAQEAGQAVE